MSDGMLIFAGLVFLAVFLLAQGMIVPVFGEDRQVRRRLQARLRSVPAADGGPSAVSLLRDSRLRRLSPFERRLEQLPGIATLGRVIEQSGRNTPAYRVALLCLLLGVAGGAAAWAVTGLVAGAALAAAGGLALPCLKVARDRSARMNRLEEQMPEAIDVIKRALKAGHPFSQALKLAADDLEDPIAREFDLTFADVNYGNDTRRAMLGLLERVPSVTVMAFVTSVLVQKETGGNLAEILDQIARVIRGRFRFHRRVRTLSAEGRLSAWILALVPLALFAVISITSPDYLPALTGDPLGQKLIAWAVVLCLLGIVWIRRIIRIRV